MYAYKQITAVINLHDLNLCVYIQREKSFHLKNPEFLLVAL